MEVFCTRKSVSFALALTLVLSLGTAALAGGAQLSDVHEGQWFYEPVSEMTAAGYIEGYEDGSFLPDRDVSVAEFVTMTARCLGLETGEEYGHWAGIQMRNAYDNGWLNEQDSAWTQFNSPVNRQLASKILAVALGLELSGGIPFSDRADVGQDYVMYVGAMCAAGMLNGFEDGTLRPAEVLTRAQAATLIYRAVNMGERITAAPDGTLFARTVYLPGYDNPNFSIAVKDGTAAVDITYAELWTDVADPGSSNPEEAAEGQRRERITEAMKQTRVIPTESAVKAVYELPCTSWFPGSDAWAIVATEDGRWYRVDLSGQYNEGIPELTEIADLRGRDVSALSWRTTTRMDGDTEYMGEDYIVAQLGNAYEVIVWPA